MTNIYIVEVGFPVIYRIMQIEKARCYIYIYLPIKTRNHPLFFFISTHTKAAKLHAAILFDVSRG